MAEEKHWIEFTSDGLARQSSRSAAQPPAYWGGSVVEVDDSVIAAQVMYADGEVIDLGPRPSFHHSIDPVARAWVSVGKTELELAQDAKWQEIKTTRDQMETEGFPYMGRTIDSDSRSVQRIALAVQAAQAAMSVGEEFDIAWTCADNGVLQLDGPAMAGMPVALAQYANTLHEAARGLREQIYAEDATVESVEEITWPNPSSS